VSRRRTVPRGSSPPVPERYLRFRDLQELFGVSRATLYNWIHQGLLPPPRRLGPKGGTNVVVWPPDVIRRFMSTRPAALGEGA
jgi:predicted DNA-binding transcriptional regulator AlpA